MLVEQLKPNIIVRGPIFPEPVQVIVAIPMGASVKLVGKGLSTNQVHELVLNAEQLAQVESSPEKEPFDGDAIRFRLGVEAYRLGLAYEYDPYFSLSMPTATGTSAAPSATTPSTASALTAPTGFASPSTVSELNQKIYAQIESWRNRPIEGNHPYVFLDGLWLKRSWGGEVRNVSLLVAIGVNEEGFREVLAVAEGSKEDKASWTSFLRHLKERGLKGVRLFVSDKCLGLVESLGEFYPEALWQRCAVHFYRNVWTAVPTSKVKEVAAMLKAIHAQEDRAAARQKAEQVAAKLKDMKLADAAEHVRTGIEETLYYYAFPREHWRSLRTNNPLERLLREVRRRTRAVGAFPDGKSALMLAAARLRHVAGTNWGMRRYLDMNRLAEASEAA